MDLDTVLEQIGEFGTYQIRNYLLVCLPVFFSAANSLTYVFTAAVPKYRCFVPNCDSEPGSYDSEWVSYAVPSAPIKKSTDFEPDLCHYFKQTAFNSSSEENTCSPDSFTAEKVRCDSWVFDEHERSIVNDWLITCVENQPALALVGSMHFVGIAAGTLLFGALADCFGRKIIFTIAIFVMAVSGIAQVFSTGLQSFYITEFLKSFGVSGVYPLAFVLGIEMVGKSKREVASMALNYFYTVGEAAVGLIAWISGDWQILQAALAGPPLLFIAYYWLLPESARWLIAKGRQDDAKKIIQKAADTNGRIIADLDTMQLGIKSHDSNLPKREMLATVLRVLRSKIMLFRILILTYQWSANAFVYYGLSLSSVNLSGNKYVNFMLVSLAGIPGYAIAQPLMNKIGRRASMAGAMILCGFTCLSGAFLDVAPTWLKVTLYLTGKMGITCSFGILYCYTSEVLPTIIRSGGVGALSTSARFAALLAPFVPLLENIEPHLPLVLFGSVAFLGGLLLFFVPETLGNKLPDTVEEAEELGRVKPSVIESTRL